MSIRNNTFCNLFFFSYMYKKEFQIKKIRIKVKYDLSNYTFLVWVNFYVI